MIKTIHIRIKIIIFYLLVVIVFFPNSSVWAQTYSENTVGLLKNDSLSFEGFTLFAPMTSTTTYLINNYGLLVHSWESSYRPGVSVYLLEDGNLLRTAKVNNTTFSAGGSGGKVQLIKWDGTVAWDYLYSSSEFCQHHDVEILPNGNVLLIAWEYKSADSAIAAGRNSNLLKQNELWPDYIVEVRPSGATAGEIIWEWHVWDHLIQDQDSTKANFGIVADHPELVNLNYVSSGPKAGNADWNHTNSVAYNKEFDQIMLSIHNFNEIWVIDHSTTTEEAASHTGGNSGKGGDILYRWGNPQAYNTGDETNRMLFGQHDAHWIKFGLPGAGNILVFNNGIQRNYSTVDEIIPPVDSIGNYSKTLASTFGPEKQNWIYSAENPADFFAKYISGAQRLPNGNTLICNGPEGIFFEVKYNSDLATHNNDIVWSYVNPVSEDGPLAQGSSTKDSKNMVFRIHRYDSTYAGLAGQDLSPGKPIEIYPTKVNDNNEKAPLVFMLKQNYPNPFNPTTTINYQIPNSRKVILKIFDILGNEVATLVNGVKPAGNYNVKFNASNLASGLYIYRIQAGDFVQQKKMMLLK